MKKTLAIILTISMILSMNPTVYAQQEQEYPFSDIENHWAKDLLTRKYKEGSITGYPDGTFNPDGLMKKSEFIAMLNRSFGLSNTKETNFKDIKGAEWYKEHGKIAKYYEYINSDTFNGEEYITRLDIAKIIGNLLDIDINPKKQYFEDISHLTQQEQNLLNSFAQQGYLQGDGNKKVNPDKELTRAEMIQLSENILGYVVKTQEDVENIPKTGRVTIIGNNITIKNKTIETLYISPGVTETITVQETKIKEIKIASEGKTILKDSKAEKLTITSKTNKSKVELYGKTTIDTIETQNKTEIEQKDKKVSIQNITIKGGETKLTGIKIKDTLSIQGGKVELVKTNIKNIIIKEKSENTHINTDSNTNIQKIIANSSTSIKGKARITEAIIKSNGVEIETKPKYTKVDKGITAKINEKQITVKNDNPKPNIIISNYKVPQGTKVKLVNDKWIKDNNNGTHIGIWYIEDLVAINQMTDGVYDSNNSGSNLDENYVLMENLDFNDINSYRNYKDIGIDADGDGIEETIYDELKKINNNDVGFRPISHGTDQFCGTFNGNDYTISNLYINRESEYCIGLFGCVSYATINNMGLIDCEIIGNNFVGGLIGDSYSTVVENSYATGNVLGNDFVGGIVGFNYSATIENSYVLGEVVGNDSVGGIVGYNYYATIKNSYALGEVVGNDSVGGIAGYNYGATIKNSYALEKVTGDDNVGGIVGYNGYSTVENSYAVGEVTGNDIIGGIVGYNFGTIVNSIAFNHKVKGKSSNTGRITGKNGGIVTNNYANENMLVSIDDSIGFNKITDGLTNDNDGSNITIDDFKLLDSYNNDDILPSLNWDFEPDISNTGITEDNDGYYWKMGADRPILYWFNGTNDTQIGNDSGDKINSNPVVIRQIYDIKATKGIAIKEVNLDDLFTDIDGDELVYTISPEILPDGILFDSTNKTISGTPVVELANINVEITANDNNGGSVTGELNIIINSSVTILPEQGTHIENTGNGYVVAENQNDKTNPIGIWSVEDLVAINQTVYGIYDSNDNGSNLDEKYVLMSDLDFNNDNSYRKTSNKIKYIPNDSLNPTNKGFNPIGNETNNFTGLFDGNTYSISNLYINRVSDDHIGLFGYIDTTTIKNIGLNYSNITGNDNVGGLVGNNNNSTIINSYATGEIAGNDYVGGLVGYNDDNSAVTNSYVVGEITGNNFAGGLVGYNYNNSAVTNSYVTGKVLSDNSAGGLVGSNYSSKISNSIAINANVTGDRAGRIIGNNNSGLINNYANENMLVSTNGGSTFSKITDGLINNRDGYNITINDFKILDSYNNDGILPSLNWDFTPDISNTGITEDEDGYYWKMGLDRPVLFWFNGTKGIQVGNDNGLKINNNPIVINPIYDIKVSQGTTIKTIHLNDVFDDGDGDSLTYSILPETLPTGILFDPTNNIISGTPIAEVTTTKVMVIANDNNGGSAKDEFNIIVNNSVTILPEQGTRVEKTGNGYVIASNQNDKNNPIGIWAIEDLGVINQSVYGIYDSNGNGNNLDENYVLMSDLNFNNDNNYRKLSNKAKYTPNDLSNPTNKGFYPVSNETNKFTGTFDGNNHTISNLYINRKSSCIGLLGYIKDAIIENIGIVDCSITGDNFVGGLVGFVSNSTVTNSYAIGKVLGYIYVGGLIGYTYDNSIVANSYAIGEVTGSYDIGGLVGNNSYSSKVTNSYTTGEITGERNVGGLVGFAYENSIVANSYTIGEVTGTYNVGGLVGVTYNDSIVANSYAIGDVTGDDNVGGLVGGINYNSKILNSIAYNAKITVSYNNTGRITGYNDSSVLINNYANSNMKVFNSNVLNIVSGGITNNENGADMAEDTFKSPDSYNNDDTLPSLDWDFTPDIDNTGTEKDNDGYYWKMSINRPILYWYNGSKGVQIGTDTGY